MAAGSKLVPPPMRKMMVESEREMVRKPVTELPHEERFTSLQPTYEDSVPLDLEDWDEE